MIGVAVVVMILWLGPELRVSTWQINVVFSEKVIVSNVMFQSVRLFLFFLSSPTSIKMFNESTCSQPSLIYSTGSIQVKQSSYLSFVWLTFHKKKGSRIFHLSIVSTWSFQLVNPRSPTHYCCCFHKTSFPFIWHTIESLVKL